MYGPLFIKLLKHYEKILFNKYNVAVKFYDNFIPFAELNKAAKSNESSP